MHLDLPMVSRGFDQGKAAWGDFGFSLEEFRDHLEEAISGRNARLTARNKAPMDGLDRLHLRDVYLALGIHRQSERAWNVFFKEYGSHLTRVLEQSTNNDDHYAESYNICVDKLPSYIRTYIGSASLKGWMAAYVSSRANDVWNRLSKNQPAHVSLDLIAHEIPDDGGVEQMLERLDDPCQTGEAKECQILVHATFESALASLDDRDRTILDLVHRKELQNKEVACILRIDPANASRGTKKATRRFKDSLVSLLDRHGATLAGLKHCLRLLHEIASLRRA